MSGNRVLVYHTRKGLKKRHQTQDNRSLGTTVRSDRSVIHISAWEKSPGLGCKNPEISGLSKILSWQRWFQIQIQVLRLANAWKSKKLSNFWRLLYDCFQLNCLLFIASQSKRNNKTLICYICRKFRSLFISSSGLSKTCNQTLIFSKQLIKKSINYCIHYV
jgi:hypothetical protein